MLDRLAAQAHLVRVPVEPRLHTASRTASCSQREIRRSLPVVHLLFGAQA
jgi:hypothetical protein